jgi:hypothetical protein
MIAGTVQISSLLSLKWYDYQLQWNISLAPGAPSVIISDAWVWKPDLSAFNGVGLFENQVTQANVIIRSDGFVSWSRTLDITYICNFGLSDFPFDEQNCPIKFGSFRDSKSTVDFDFDDSDEGYQLNDLAAQEWKVRGVHTSKSEDYLGDSLRTFLTWSLSLKRYSSYYATTIIIPLTIISFIGLLALLINDISSRLVLASTSVLIMIALQWSTAESLPITQDVSWLQSYSTSCVVFVVLICAETTLAAFMTMRKGTPPCWITYLIVFSTPRKIYRFFTASDSVTNIVSGSNQIASINSNSSELSTASHPKGSKLDKIIYEDDEEEEGPQWHFNAGSTLGLLNRKLKAATGMISNNPMLTESNADVNSDQVASTSIRPTRKSHKTIVDIERQKVTWLKGARSLDRMSRIIFSGAYFLLLIIYFSKINQ